MAENSLITWEIATWTGLPSDKPDHPLYTDKANAIKALNWLKDIEATAENLGQRSLQAMFNDFYNSGAKGGALQFRGFSIDVRKPTDAFTKLYVDFGEGGFTDVGEDAEAWLVNARKLSKMPAEKRSAVRFVSVVTLGNTVYSLASRGWTVETWMETIIHEVGIHVWQDIETIRLWRQGSPWTTSFVYGELDHYTFRYRGTPRYIWWCNQIATVQLGGIGLALHDWNNKEAERYKGLPGYLTVKRFLEAAAQLKKYKQKQPNVILPVFNFGDAWLIAERFDPEYKSPENLGLFAIVNAQDELNPIVDMERSEEFVLRLEDELTRLFSGQPLVWWDKEVHGKK